MKIKTKMKAAAASEKNTLYTSNKWNWVDYILCNDPNGTNCWGKEKK